MAVNLRKEPEMREYTPVHLIDEEDTMPKKVAEKSVTHLAVEVVTQRSENAKFTDANTSDDEIKPKLNPVLFSEFTPATKDEQLVAAMNKIIAEIEHADAKTQEKFCNHFMPTAKDLQQGIERKRKQSNPLSTLISQVFPRFAVVCFLAFLIVFCGDFCSTTLTEIAGEYGSFFWSVFSVVGTLANIMLVISGVITMIKILVPGINIPKLK